MNSDGDELDAMIERLWREGATDRAIAAALEEQGLAGARGPLTLHGVKQRRHARGWIGPPVEPVDRERLRELWAAGLSGAQIAAALGCTHRTVQELCWRDGLPLSGDRRPRK